MQHNNRNQFGSAGPDVASLRRCCGRYPSLLIMWLGFDRLLEE